MLASGAGAGIRQLGYLPTFKNAGPGGRLALRSLRLRDLNPGKQQSRREGSPDSGCVSTLQMGS